MALVLRVYTLGDIKGLCCLNINGRQGECKELNAMVGKARTQTLLLDPGTFMMLMGYGGGAVSPGGLE